MSALGSIPIHDGTLTALALVKPGQPQIEVYPIGRGHWVARLYWRVTPLGPVHMLSAYAFTRKRALAKLARKSQAERRP